MSPAGRPKRQRSSQAGPRRCSVCATAFTARARLTPTGGIGDAAYALVLSRYGQLMTTLFLGQDLAGPAGSATVAPIQSPPLVNINNMPAAGGQTKPTGPAGGQPNPARSNATAANSGGQMVVLASGSQDAAADPAAARHPAQTHKGGTPAPGPKPKPDAEVLPTNAPAALAK